MDQWWAAWEQYDIPTDAHQPLRKVVRRTVTEEPDGGCIFKTTYR